MARDIDRKLRLTAAVLGTATCKALAAAFRRANPSTAFDVDRAYKWLQGRARPRDPQLYEDWAKVLELDRTGEWLAASDVETFLDEVALRHGRDRTWLRDQAEASVTAGGARQTELAPTGTFACYSHAWSPYFQGRLIRGGLSIAAIPKPHRLVASYAESLPTGRLQLDGAVAPSKHVLRLDLRERRGDAQLFFCLFPPTPPFSVLGGLICGGTIIGPNALPSVSRIVMVRLPAAGVRPLREIDAYLPLRGSVAADLAALGLPTADPAAIDRHLGEFLAGGGNRFDQVSLASYGALLELFDRAWLLRGVNAAA
ncbi:hypothetical protein [Labrys wisconsinensis]|uniref:Uncharacterized protein n=1 Tax=Labrys wisconsinensis TaxID=425677 RepID=A0ABU0J2U3_9HYPH|nr:hypothetical protein [Labrys wisconsinensis]MDQ0468581.1 hypothetical protein [Labrys wisconsinensis]